MKTVILVLSILLSLTKATAPNESKQYRNNYEYKKETDAFYKLHIESRRGYKVKEYCELEGAKLMIPTPQDVVQGHAMFKRYPDLGPYAWVDRDGVDHESAEEQPIIDLTTEDDDDDKTNFGVDCDVMMRHGEIRTVPCHNDLPFICKVDDKDAPYDPHCDVYATGYHYYPEVGSCYKVPEVAYSWNEAYAECQNEGAHLVVINSKEEHDVVKNIIDTAKPVYETAHKLYFLAGFRAVKPSRVFMTVFNQTLEEAGYSEWSATEPNNLYNAEYCGSLFKIDGKLNDMTCTSKFAFICEKEVRT